MGRKSQLPTETNSQTIFMRLPKMIDLHTRMSYIVCMKSPCQHAHQQPTPEVISKHYARILALDSTMQALVDPDILEEAKKCVEN